MKRKILMACAILLLTAATSNNYAQQHAGTSYDKVIGDYIESVMNSDYKKLKQVLSDDASVKIPRNEKVIVQAKDKLVEMMKNENGTKQNCTYNYEVIAKSDAIIIARVDFKYELFKQENYVTIEKNEDRDWKITQVYKIFYNNTRQAPTDVSASTIN